MIKNYIKKNPFVFCLILFLIHFLAAYPRGMTPDSYHQFFQSLNFYDVTSHHPPLMAMVWSVFNYIYTGPQLYLLFHLSMLWVSVYILYKADENNKYSWLYCILPFTPGIFAVSGMIWKDIGFAYSFFLCFSICIYYHYKQIKPSLLVLILLLLTCFYGVSVKFQAKFIAPILIYFIVSLFFTNWWKRIITCIIISIIIIGSNTLIIRHFTRDYQ